MLNQIQEHLGLKKDAEFARYLDITPQTLSNWKSRNTFDMEIIYTKCELINPHWLITGERQMLKNEQKSNSTPYPNPIERVDLVPEFEHSLSLKPRFVLPTHENCSSCEEKERIIALYEENNLLLREMIEVLREKLGNTTHQAKEDAG